MRANQALAENYISEIASELSMDMSDVRDRLQATDYEFIEDYDGNEWRIGQRDAGSLREEAFESLVGDCTDSLSSWVSAVSTAIAEGWLLVDGKTAGSTYSESMWSPLSIDCDALFDTYFDSMGYRSVLAFWVDGDDVLIIEEPDGFVLS